MRLIRFFWYWLGRLISYILLPFLFRWILKGSRRTRLIVYCNGKILVERSWLGEKSWILPGGGLKSGEEVKIGAARELKEEVGISVYADQIKVLAEEKSLAKGYDFTLVYCLIVLDKPEKIKTGHLEIFDAKWLPIDEIDTTDVLVDVVRGLELSVQARPNLLQ